LKYVLHVSAQETLGAEVAQTDAGTLSSKPDIRIGGNAAILTAKDIGNHIPVVQKWSI
jgi:hypothetical protein